MESETNLLQAQPALPVEDVEAGCEMLHEIQDEPWGTRDFTVLDADRNAITFAEVLP